MRICIAIIFCLFSLAIEAGQKAVTDEGDIVILNDDGTWSYENPDSVVTEDILTNSEEFEKSPDSLFRLKSTINDSEVWLDTKRWSFSKSTSNEAAEYEFQLKGGDLYGMLITEQITIDMEYLTQIALGIARDAAADMRVTHREYRIVNGNKVIYMEMQGTAQGIKFTYRGYYFSNETGSTQFITYTGTNLVEKYSSDIQDVLNGFSVQ